MTAGDVIVVDGAVGPARQAAAFDGIDDYFEDSDGEMGMEEVIGLIKHLKKNKPELFN